MSEVVLVTGRNCSNCLMLKKMLKLMRLEYDRTVDSSEDEAAKIIEFTKARSIPVLARVSNTGKVKDFVIGLNHTDKRFSEVCNG
jgi:glutaredoxin